MRGATGVTPLFHGEVKMDSQLALEVILLHSSPTPEADVAHGTAY